MKKLTSIVIFSVIFIFAFFKISEAKYITPIKIFDNLQVIKGGASVFCLDLTGTQYDEAEVFSIQMSDATPYYAAYSGATIPFINWSTSNILPPGVNGGDVDRSAFTSTYIHYSLGWSNAFPYGMAHDSGNTRFVYTFYPDGGRFLFLRVDNTEGVTDFKVTSYLGMKKKTSNVYSINVGSLIGTITATTGVSTIYSGISRYGNSAGETIGSTDDYGNTLPEWAQYGELEVISQSGNSLFYTVDNKVFNRADAKILQDEEGRELNRNELENLQMGATGAVKWRIDLYSRKPQ